MIVHTNESYSLAVDEDGHWFLIPSHKHYEWDKWIDDNVGKGFDAEWIVPEWAQPIDGGPRAIQFNNPSYIVYMA
jgi:hypothetical protein